MKLPSRKGPGTVNGLTDSNPRDQELRAAYDLPCPQLPNLWTWVPDPALKLTEQVLTGISHRSGQKQPKEACAHACSGCVTGSLPGDWCETPTPCCPSWRWHMSVSGMEESEWELDEPLSTPGRLCSRWGTCLTRHRKPVVPRKPLPIPRGKHPSLSADYPRTYSTQEKTGVPPH